MKLIKVEAYGFKSFADPITLSFDGGVAGIVGPNGSGKSNINDAIKWVLGEQSSKELRGDSMSDVIFAGSKTVPAMDKATVTLTFDNRMKLSSYDSDYVSITRSVERGKGSTYYINGLVSKQKEIKSLAMETGIGKSSLAIISQGTVSDIAEATDEQRRAIFEEAAGVSKYKFKKQESLRKLEKVSETLNVISAKVFELEKQLSPLKKQAEKAKIYLEKSEALKNVEVALISHEIVNFSKEFTQLEKDLEGVKETKQEFNERIESMDTNINQFLQAKEELRKEISRLSGTQKAMLERINDLKLIENKEKQRQELIVKGELKVNIAEQISTLKNFLEETKHKINYFESERNQTEEKLNEYESQITSLNDQINSKQVLFQNLSSKKTRLETQLSILEKQKETRSNIYKGPKTILENQLYFKGVKGIVADLIKVKDEYANAIEAILSSTLQNVVVDKSQTAVECINFLKNNNGGRATFIPLNVISPKFIRDDHLLAVQTQKGFIDVAANLVETKAQFSILKDFLLGNILVTDTIESANKLADILNRKYMIVSLDGDIIRAGGVLYGGQKNSDHNSLLKIDSQIEEVKKLIPDATLMLKQIESEIVKLKSSRSELYNYVAELQKNKSQILERKNNANNEFNAAKLKLQNISSEEIKLSESISRNSENLEILVSKEMAISAELRAKSNRYQEIESDIVSIQISKNDLEKSLRELNKKFNDKSLRFDRLAMILKENQNRLAHFYKITLENALENFTLNLEVEEARKFVNNTREEIEKLGNINLDSIEQFKQVEERYNNINSNKIELEEAKKTMEEAIAQMDKIIISRLSNIVYDVNDEFNNVFRTMFGGGSANIYFTDKNNILESGIAIKAQPPGKSVKNLKLFSGGEKSLIAISLLFGILKARPLPLCILDEVEAALDEANVVRYAEYLQALKSKTQFLVITHRHGTMSRMDTLFGATMQKRGVTSFFGLQLEQAKEILNTKVEK